MPKFTSGRSAARFVAPGTFSVACLVAAAAVFLCFAAPRSSTTLPFPTDDHLLSPATIVHPATAPLPVRLSLSADQHQALAAVAAALRAPVSAADDLEPLLWRLLPELLEAGGSHLADGLLAACPPGFARQTLLRVCAIAWPRLDPEDALAWAAQLPDATERHEARERVLASMVNTDPAKALDAARALEDSGESDGNLTVQLVGAWADRDFRATRAWVLKLPPGGERDDCLARVATVQANSSPEDAARFALKHLPPGPLLEETLISAVYQWAGRDPAAARQWVETFPDGSLRDRALQEISGTAMTPVGRPPTPGISLVPIGNAP